MMHDRAPHLLIKMGTCNPELQHIKPLIIYRRNLSATCVQHWIITGLLPILFHVRVMQSFIYELLHVSFTFHNVMLYVSGASMGELYTCSAYLTPRNNDAAGCRVSFGNQGNLVKSNAVGCRENFGSQVNLDKLNGLVSIR
jgi:hypothetical protein